ncbi:MAG: GntR family transcriptional regulator, partial [Pseudomonadales bacterium]
MAEARTMTRAEEVAEVLRDEILRGQYRPGERLPSERELASRFETNRGAVREAVKKLEQLGIAAVHPGGARVVPIEEATLDVIGPLLNLNSLPDVELIDQITEVMGAMMVVAVRHAVERASEDEIAQARAIVRRLKYPGDDEADRIQARMELGRFFMSVSQNLVLRLIANSLRMQFVGRIKEAMSLTRMPSGYAELLEQLDGALEAKDPRAAGE